MSGRASASARRLSRFTRSLLERLTFAPATLDDAVSVSSSITKVGTSRDPHLCGLPEDVLLLIFTLLPAGDLLTCKLVCWSLLHIIQDDVRIQYKIELDVNGMTNGAPAGMPLAARLQMLRELRVRSRSAIFSCSENLWPSIGARVQIMVAGGTILYVKHRSTGCDIEIRPLPSVEAGAPTSRHIQVPLVGQEVRLETVDLAQDLMLMSVQTANDGATSIYLLTIETGTAHPSAAHPVLNAVSERGRLFPVQIYQQFVVWQICSPGTSYRDVEIWNWQLGRLIWRHSFRPQISYAFLDASHLIITSERQEDVKVYRFGSQDQSEATPIAPEVDPILTLELPLGAFRCAVHYDDRYRVPPATHLPSAPFRPGPASTVLTIRFAIYAPELSTALFLVPYATIYEQIKDVGTGSAQPARVFWHEWGPEGGLLLNMSGPEVIPRVVISPYGSRVAVLVRDKYRRRSAYVVIFDLNPWAVRTVERRSSEGAGRLTPLKDLGAFRFRALRATVPYVAYCGPTVAYPKNHKPTVVSMNHNGFTILHEWNPPYQERLGVGYQTYYT